jgi:hypothetical protein
MIDGKYVALGFDISSFGANSKVLRFNQKAVFVFSSNSNIDIEFLSSICEAYLKMRENVGQPLLNKIAQPE